MHRHITHSIVFSILIFLGPTKAHACEDTILIEDVDSQVLFTTYINIVSCVAERGSVSAYVRGAGGSLKHALAFFDLIRTTPELSSKITFIAVGEIASASNIVWLSAGKRVVLPGSNFLLHSATWNMTEETNRARTEDASQVLESTRTAVQVAVSDESATLWATILEGDAQGRILSAEEALKIGWATELRPYVE
jgi:ATP-dependent protease ClpP protease subunit